jgi:hypothetical protein
MRGDPRKSSCDNDCNTLQHTATLRNTLQHSAMHTSTEWGVHVKVHMIMTTCRTYGCIWICACLCDMKFSTCVCVFGMCMLEMNHVLGIIRPRCCSNGHTGQDKKDRVGMKERREIG